jgi:hypothetical protein
MWIERSADGVWRGSVFDVSTGDRLYVTSADEVAAYIFGALDRPGASENE